MALLHIQTVKITWFYETKNRKNIIFRNFYQYKPNDSNRLYVQ